jgi:hypothetical protein
MVLALLLLPALLVACNPFGLRDLLDAATRSTLSIDPTDVTIPAGATLTFSADGGVPGYTYSVFSGGGSIDPATGEYTAPLAAGTAVVRVTDAAGATADTGITIEELMTGLSLSPLDITVVVNCEVQFTPVGGTGPTYTYAITDAQSGSPDINPGTGYYVAGSGVGTDEITVTDFLGATATAAVHVVALASAVNYDITSTAGLPAAAMAGDSITGSPSFTLANIGLGNGASAVSWAVHLSADAVLDGGDVVVASGTTGQLASLASTGVALSGTWPVGPIGPGYLIATVEAADDTSPGDNSASAAFTLQPRQVDYRLLSVNHLGGTYTGQTVTGDFTVENWLTAAGASTIYWYAYASTDGTIDGGDFLLQSGSRAALGAGASAAIGISSTWPTTPADYFLLVRVSAADDINSGNDIGSTAAPVTVTGAPPADINYTVAAPVNTGSTTAGDTLSGTFQVTNAGTVAGSQDVYWTIYRSDDATLDTGTDPIAAMGSRAALGAGGSAVVGYSSTWPAGTWTWHLFAVVSAGDDVNPLNNQSAGTSVGVTAPDVDYAPAAPINTGGTTAGESLAGTFQVTNTGAAAGSQTVFWTVYRSPDATLETGSDPVVAVGSRAALGPGGSAVVPYTGTWPAAAATWHLFAVVSAGDDNDAGNDDSTGTSIGVAAPAADYDVLSVVNTGGTVAGYPLAGFFTATNLGPHDGTQAVPWRVYLSTDNNYDAGIDLLIASGVIASPGLDVAEPSGNINFAGTWPNGAGSWYIVVVLDAGDDQTPANDEEPSVLIPTTAPNVNYDVLTVTNTGGTTAGDPMAGEFSVRNVGAALGTSTLYWIAYRSDDAILTIGTDYAIDSGSTAALPDFNPLTIPFGNAWPSAIVVETYYLFVSVFAADDISSANDTDMSAVVTVNPPNVDYIVQSVAVDVGLRRPAQPVSGTFRYHNSGLHAGTPSQTLNWEVYASKENTTIDANDTLVAYGTGLPAQGSGATSGDIPWAGSWPLSHGDYYIVVRVACAEDVNTANNAGSTALPDTIGVYNETAMEPNDDYVGLTNPVPLGITLQPGMTVKITGSLANADRDDVFQFNTGTAARVVVTVAWSINDQNVRIWFMDGPNSFVDGVSGLSASMSLDWAVDAAGVSRWIDLDNYWSGTDYTPPPNPVFLTYTCWIVAQ